MVEKKKSKSSNTPDLVSQSSDDKFALTIMNFFVYVFYSIFNCILTCSKRIFNPC